MTDLKNFKQTNHTYYSKENGCPFCGSKTKTKIIERELLSNFYCNDCGAIFYSLELNDTELAGAYTDAYVQLPKEQLYKHGFNSKK